MTEQHPFEVRLLSREPSLAMDEINQCIRIQESIKWHPEIVPAHVFRADSINLIDPTINLGYVLVAVRKIDGSVIGFARVTFTADLDKHWLHEIAVSPEAQSQNVGFEIMKAIKTQSLKLGGTYLYFTYDPLEGQNGRLYLSKCGAKAIRVYENLYGEIKSSAHGNRKTHRFLVCWNMRFDKPLSPASLNLDTIPIISRLPLPTEYKRFGVAIPYRVQDLSPQEAARWQGAIFPILMEAINLYGYRAVYLQTDKVERCNFLVLER